jgi:hypothetical protein
LRIREELEELEELHHGLLLCHIAVSEVGSRVVGVNRNFISKSFTSELVNFSTSLASPNMSEQQPIALLSVYDKAGLLPFAQGLAEQGVRLLGSGGTAKAIRNAGMDIGYVQAPFILPKAEASCVWASYISGETSKENRGETSRSRQS